MLAGLRLEGLVAILTLSFIELTAPERGLRYQQSGRSPFTFAPGDARF